jgi:hypothetical protein
MVIFPVVWFREKQKHLGWDVMYEVTEGSLTSANIIYAIKACAVQTINGLYKHL